MNRRKFIGLGGGAILGVGAVSYLLSDKSNLTRDDIRAGEGRDNFLRPDEKEILYLASLAPSGHNTQPWFVEYVEPYHWIIGNDRTKWLPAVDPAQREIVLSIGAFVQNLEYAAHSFGYSCDWTLLGRSNQDERILEVRLHKKGVSDSFDIDRLRLRRTMRSKFSNDALKKEDLDFLVDSEAGSFRYFPFEGRGSQFINEQTIEANRIQAYRDPAQQELADWIRLSSKDAEQYRDGLTTAGLEIDGAAGWIVRNFYGKADVMKTDFRERGLARVREQVAGSAGWVLILSKDGTLESLLEAGRKMQRFFLKARERNIGVHPMTQILEEEPTRNLLNQSIGIAEEIQFILRTGYVKNYPPPVSLRRPVDWFVRRD